MCFFPAGGRRSLRAFRSAVVCIKKPPPVLLPAAVRNLACLKYAYYTAGPPVRKLIIMMFIMIPVLISIFTTISDS
jgi:hypothetical protein